MWLSVKDRLFCQMFVPYTYLNFLVYSGTYLYVPVTAAVHVLKELGIVSVLIVPLFRFVVSEVVTELDEENITPVQH